MGANFQEGIMSTGLGQVLGRLFNMPAQAGINSGQAALNEARPSQAVGTGSMQSRYEAAINTPSNQLTGTAARNAGITATPGQISAIKSQLTKFTKPDGTVDFQAAAASGIDLSVLGIDPSKMSVEDLQGTLQQDEQTALSAAQEDKARADALAEDVDAGKTSSQAALTDTKTSVEQGQADLLKRVDQTAAQAALAPDKVVAFGAKQMADLQAVLAQGLSKIGTEQASALKGIADNMANDLSSSTSATRSNLAAQKAAIMSDPSIPPEARAKLSSQATMAAGQQAAEAAAPIRRMYRELESNTRTAFGHMFTSFGTAAASTTGSLAGVQTQEYSRSVENTNRINSELTGIVQAAEATRGTTQAYLDNLSFQVENGGNELLKSLLPSQSTPFILDSPNDMLIFGMGTDLASLSYNEELTNLNIDMAQMGVDNQSVAGTIQGIQGMQTAPQPSSNSGAQIGSSLIGAAGGIGAAAVLASDENEKTGFQFVDTKALLEKVRSLGVHKWSYKDSGNVAHVGPMAQDFHEKFGLGDSDKTIHMVDAIGVLIASVQALASEVERLKGGSL